MPGNEKTHLQAGLNNRLAVCFFIWSENTDRNCGCISELLKTIIIQNYYHYSKLQVLKRLKIRNKLEKTDIKGLIVERNCDMIHI